MEWPANNFNIILFALMMLLFYHITTFYQKTLRYPKGPLPLPIIGNLHYIIHWSWVNNGQNPNRKLVKLRRQFGSIFTLWLCSKPCVFINDPTLLRQAFQQTDFSDRSADFLVKVAFSGSQDFALADHTPEQNKLRKTAIIALRKYVINERLADQVNDCVNDTFEVLVGREDVSKPIDFRNYIHFILHQISAAMFIGKRYSIDDKEFLHFVDTFVKGQRWFDVLFFLDMLPKRVLNCLYHFIGSPAFMGFPEMSRILRKEFRNHLETFDQMNVRDFTDALIAANIQTKTEPDDDAFNCDQIFDVDISNDGWSNALFDVFFASVDSTRHLLEWVFLLMIKHPTMQSKMREEIRSVIGDNRPTQQHRDDCHFTAAFISEALRLNTPLSIGTPHATRNDVEIDRQIIPKGAMVIGYSHSINRSGDLWSRPDEFDPNRFLDDNGVFVSNIDKLASFGVGRRSCPGDRLAMVDAFLVVVRLLQLTDKRGLVFAKQQGQELSDESEPSQVFFSMPKEYKIILENKS